MKKTLLIILLGFISVACKEEKKKEIIIDAKKIEDSINKVREQEVLNLNVVFECLLQSKWVVEYRTLGSGISQKWTISEVDNSNKYNVGEII